MTRTTIMRRESNKSASFVVYKTRHFSHCKPEQMLSFARIFSIVVFAVFLCAPAVLCKESAAQQILSVLKAQQLARAEAAEEAERHRRRRRRHRCSSSSSSCSSSSSSCSSSSSSSSSSCSRRRRCRRRCHRWRRNYGYGYRY